MVDTCFSERGSPFNYCPEGNYVLRIEEPEESRLSSQWVDRRIETGCAVNIFKAQLLLIVDACCAIGIFVRDFHLL